MKHNLEPNLNTVAPADITIIETAIGTVNTKIAPAINTISTEQKKDYQIIGPKLESIVRIAQKAAHDFPNLFPGTFDVDFIDTFMQNFDDFNHLNNLLSVPKLNAENTALTNGILAADQANIIYSFLQMALPKHPEVKEYVDAMADYYKKAPREDAITFSINSGTSIDINHAVPKSMVINKGITRLVLLAGPELSGNVQRVDRIYIEPGNSAEIPAGYTSITIRNESADQTGSFSIRIK